MPARRNLIPITEAESVAIIKAGYVLRAAFGTGGVALIWEDDEPKPNCVRYLERLRGIATENMSGLGI